MAVVFCDGFDHYQTADILKKWNATASSPTIESSGRNGGRCLQLNRDDSETVSKTIPAAATYYFGWAFKIGAHTAGSNEMIMEFRDAGTVQCTLAITQGGLLQAYRDREFSGTLLATGSTPLSLSAWYYIEVKLTIHNSSGVFDVRINETPEISFSGDTQTTGNATMDDIKLYSTSSTAATLYDDLYINDSGYYGDIKIETLRCNGAGGSAQWSRYPDGGEANWQNVDEEYVIDDDSTYNSHDTATEKDLYTMTNLDTTSGTVQAVAVHACCRKDDGGSRSIATILEQGTTETDGSTKSIGDSYLYYTDYYDENPDGGGEPWTIADVNDIEAGIKLIS